MKHKIVALVTATVLALGLQAHAADPITPENKLFCDGVYSLAYNTMIVRQMDFTKEEMTTQVKELVDLPQAVEEALEIVESAFEVSLVEPESVEVISIGFGQFHEEKCLKKNSGIAL